MWGRRESVSSEGSDLDDAASNAVSQHYGQNRSIRDIENIVVEVNGEQVVITDRQEIQKFLDQYNR